MKLILSLFFLFAFAICVQGQVTIRPVVSSTSDPSVCVTGKLYINTTSPGKVWARIAGGCVRVDGVGAGVGDVVGPSSSVDSEIALFSSTTGKLIKRATTSGILKATSGVIAAAAAGTDYVAPGGALGTPSSGTLTNATGLPEGGLSLTDITTNNFSITKHGFVPKGTNVGSFLRDDGTWAAPTGGITNSAGVGVVPYTLDGSGNLGASPITRTDSNTLTTSSQILNLGGTTSGFASLRGRVGFPYQQQLNLADNSSRTQLWIAQVNIDSAADSYSTAAYIGSASSDVGVGLASGGKVAWSSNASDAQQAKDTGVSRISSATVGVGNGTSGDFSGTLKATTGLFVGPVTVGNGTAILKHLSATATLDFANLAAIGCEDLTVTVTGAALGDTVALGVPNGSVVANGTFTGWVNAADTVTIRFCTVVSGNPASGTFRADVWQH